jgi:endonuclease/exonuclease/phosphatase family metal-dependent hydrolase
MVLRVLTWNLYHGRAVPPAGRHLLADFASALAGWSWDVALLQEVPPWWPPELARATEAAQRSALTSRNWLAPARQAIAIRWPDAIKSNGGGANTILVRGVTVSEHRKLRLCSLPERRWMHAVGSDGLWVANLHATAHDASAAVRDAERARRRALGWASGAPLVLGGDFNLHRLSLEGFVHAGGHDVDHVFAANGLEPAAEPEVLDHGRLSDHAAVVVTLRGS